MKKHTRIVIPNGESVSYGAVDKTRRKESLRSKLNLVVSDLAQKPWKVRERRNYEYIWNLVTVSLFYSLPVVQLVYLWQWQVTHLGNQDICYYNFLCAQPLFGIYAFNSVFSSVGYVLLGLLYLIMVFRREQRMLTLFPHDTETREPPKHGIPHHYGIFYALGIAMMMEGLMSSCYHICPSHENYQFDTSYMYMMVMLGTLKIYQMRHPDINPSSHVVYGLMAFAILSAMVGVFISELPFWILFAVTFCIVLLMINLEIYYVSLWRIDYGIRVREQWQTITWKTFFRPTFPDARFVFLCIADGINLTILTLGIIHRPNFPLFLLVIFIMNLFIYWMYYILMKIWHGQKFHLRVKLAILLSLMAWSGSFVLFVKYSYDWEVSPAKSREINTNCVLLDFYDYHDLWHFLSAIALFLAFSALLSMDDDLNFTDREQIPVF